MVKNEKKSSFLGSSDGSSSGVNWSCSEMNNTIPQHQSQDFENIVSDFSKHKALNDLLADSYYRLGNDKKSSLVRGCGSFLEFAIPQFSENHIISDSDKPKLVNANFCKDRLCPICVKRLSYKIFGQLSRVVDLIVSDYEFIFLTLTVRNVPGEELSDTLDRFNKAFHLFCNYKEIKNICKGYFRSIEITRNDKKRSFWYKTYHPHMHLILAVPKDYFSSSDYLSQKDFLRLWRKAYRDDTILCVNVQKVYRDDLVYSSDVIKDIQNKSLSGSIKELSKYFIKSSDYLKEDNIYWTDETVDLLSKVLYHRRLIGYGGIFKEMLLKLGETELSIDSDLTDNIEPLNDIISWLIVKLNWSSGMYKIFDEDIISDSEMRIRKGDYRVLDIEVSDNDN